MKTLILFFSFFFHLVCRSQETTVEDSIACSQQYNYYFHMAERQKCLDKGLKHNPTSAYLWQQKAMPYFKVRKYEVGMEYLEKAVQYNRKRYLPYKAFINCIFIKNYKQAISDFKNCIEEFGNSYEMDHLYTFYIGLSYLQLNNFTEAEYYLKKSIEQDKSTFNEAHYLDLFYYALSLYEQQKYTEAIVSFDEAITLYPEFSDAIYYKALSLYKEDKSTKAHIPLIEQAQNFAKKGYSINEANSIYELYPYQISGKITNKNQ